MKLGMVRFMGNSWGCGPCDSLQKKRELRRCMSVPVHFNVSLNHFLSDRASPVTVVKLFTEYTGAVDYWLPLRCSVLVAGLPACIHYCIKF